MTEAGEILAAVAGCGDGFCPGNMGMEGRCNADAIMGGDVNPSTALNILVLAQRCQDGTIGCPVGSMCLKRNTANIQKARELAVQIKEKADAAIERGKRRPRGG